MRYVSALFFSWSMTATLALAGPAYVDPAKTDADFPFQGEYVGKLDISGKQQATGAQVIALGKGKFDAVIYTGGLPGAGWNRGDAQQKLSGERKDETISLTGGKLTGKISGGKLTLADSGGQKLGVLEKTERKSPTLGKKPPEGAVVLFDGSGLDQFQKGARITEDGLLMEGCKTKPAFQGFTLHFEFRTPYKPEDRGQGRGNSGIYMQSRYEVQVLDSFGLAGKHNECGGIYSVKDPDVNMCLPPLTWQTYDVEFTPAQFEGGKKVKHARMTVKHNGGDRA